METSLVLTIFFLCGLNAYQLYQSKKERDRLVNALLSRTPQEFKQLETPPAKEREAVAVSPQPDLVSMDELSQEDWNKVVLGDTNGRQS